MECLLGDFGANSVAADDGGDGIGPEVTEQALHVLEQTVGSDAFATHEYHLGAAHWKATGEVLDNSTLAEIAQE
ncbi:isocitrate/isopropylmalate family dehydrogenase, partial [Clavibacter michiganensis]|uniref:isocitrate/isopropylmalate family dehydrogenase n=1 Tax=Clavibacter michiganensis TaxID=28447 RepID=UPI00292F3D33